MHSDTQKTRGLPSPGCFPSVSVSDKSGNMKSIFECNRDGGEAGEGTPSPVVFTPPFLIGGALKTYLFFPTFHDEGT